MRELTLHASPGNWQKFIARRMSPAFKHVALKILKRDKYTCQYCGFQAKEYQDIVNHDQDYRNNKASNLVTACCFCSQCFFLESVGLDDVSGGQLVYMPEVTQADLNSFCHVLFCAMSSETKYQDSAQIIYRNLKYRSHAVVKTFGEGSGDPRRMGAMLIEYQNFKNNPVPDKVFDGLRLLPIQSKFSIQLEAWAKSALIELSGKEAQNNG